MRNISFMFTTKQVRARKKTVTRRVGWRNLKPGALLRGVEKGMGLKVGEKVVTLAVIRVLSVRMEKLSRMIDDPAYGFGECEREGFGDHSSLRLPSAFVDYFCASHRGCSKDSEITRVEFEYVDAESG